MLIGLGHDLQSVHELARAQALWEPGIFFTEREIARFRCSHVPVESLTATFAGKEALFKALPPVGVWFWSDAELLHDEDHRPRFHYHGALKALMSRRGWQSDLSISHSGGFVSTIVIVTSGPRAPTL